MKKLVIGILAPVDAGKTTLAEALLYLGGKIKKLGRVDKKDAFLDTHGLERERGITIFSEQAVLNLGKIQITLLDTPGHVDFSAETERTVQVLDYAILVISGADGVQAHTKTLWRLLGAYKIPVFIFANKMDQAGTNSSALLRELKKELAEGCLQFGAELSAPFWEEVALRSEELMEAYLSQGKIKDELIGEAIHKRRVFPCYFGSALKMQGLKEFLQDLLKLVQIPVYPREFGAKIFKISRDERGNRLTHLKLVGGSLGVRDLLVHPDWEGKINQIRIYSGKKFKTAEKIEAGGICAVTGLDFSRPGEVLGLGKKSRVIFVEPVLSYHVLLPSGSDPLQVLKMLRQIKEEQPELHLVWDEKLQQIGVQIMGEVQLEILQSLVQARFGIKLQFDAGKVLYKETISNSVEGVGHFEPLGHYAEVHLLLEPAKLGSSLQFGTDCSQEILASNWQQLILTNLKEKNHKGVLTGSPLTDLKITLVAGRAQHTLSQRGDFKEAAWRALRQGLKEAQSVLLEPYYSFELEVPKSMIGRALVDLERMQASCEISGTSKETALLIGAAPAVKMRNYHREVIAYTQGLGRLFCNLAGYRPCHNTEEVVADVGYDSERDLENPTGSIFCKGSSAFFVAWDQVKTHRHVESRLLKPQGSRLMRLLRPSFDYDQEIDYELLARTVSANRGKKRSWKKKKKAEALIDAKTLPTEVKEEYLLVDGYNIIHAWPELKEFATENMDLARIKLLDALVSYQAIRDCRVVVVFDAHLVPGRIAEISNYHNLRLVFTKEAQTADQYIEKFAYDNQEKYRIRVATSDGLQQVILRSANSYLLSAQDLKEEVEKAKQEEKNSINTVARAAPISYLQQQSDRSEILK